MKYLAFDVHIRYCELSVRNHKGKEIDQKWVPTETGKLIEAVKAIRGQKTLVVEEGTLADWMKRTLEPYVTRFVISNPKRNNWIAKDEDKDDPLDARKLSHLLFGGFIKEVHHPTEERQHFKELVLHYHRLTRQVIRCKNILKAKFRQNGMACRGTNVYSEKGRSKWLELLPHPLARAEAEDLYVLLDATVSVQTQGFERMAQQAGKYPQIKRFCKIPGIGLIHACTFFAIIDTPHRFPKKAKLWVYCGLGLKRRKSGGRVYRQNRKQNYNRYLKAMAKQATQSALNTHDDNPFKDQYHRLCEKGIDPELAHVIVARSLITTMWGIWKSDQDYQPEKRHMPLVSKKA